MSMNAYMGMNNYTFLPIIGIYIYMGIYYIGISFMHKRHFAYIGINVYLGMNAYIGIYAHMGIYAFKGINAYIGICMYGHLCLYGHSCLNRHLFLYRQNAYKA